MNLQDDPQDVVINVIRDYAHINLHPAPHYIDAMALGGGVHVVAVFMKERQVSAQFIDFPEWERLNPMDLGELIYKKRKIY
jgi:hypothetical protein